MKLYSLLLYYLSVTWSPPSVPHAASEGMMWAEYLGKFTFMGETRNQAPIYVKAVPNTWMEKMNPPTLSRELDGKWYVQSPWETENDGAIFRCKTILFL